MFNYRWMSDALVKKLRDEGFLRVVFFRGALLFGVGSAVILTIYGYFSDGAALVQKVWWKGGIVGFIIGGIVWGAILWSIAQSSVTIREVICWLFGAAAIVFLVSVVLLLR